MGGWFVVWFAMSFRGGDNRVSFIAEERVRRVPFQIKSSEFGVSYCLYWLVVPTPSWSCPGEVESFCADLSGRLHINRAVHISVDKLHDLLFSADTHFIQHLFSQRHFTGLYCEHTHRPGKASLCN